MAKRQLRRKHPQTGVSGRSRRLVAALTLATVCAGSVTLVAHVNSRKKAARKSGDVSVASFAPAAPSKEYIYGGGGKLIATEEPPGCSYSISPTSASFTASSGSGSVTVTAGTGCAWTATSNATWITITAGASGTGSGTVSYSGAANTGAARTGTVTIAGQAFTVDQTAASCTYSISPPSASFTATSGTGSVSVTAGAGCTWTATSNATWITITAGASWSGNGSVSYSVAANTGAPRTGTMTIAGQTFTVSQAAADGGYAFRRSITVDHTKVPNTDQSNFPVLISGTYPYLATAANGGNVQNPSGYDVIFTSDSVGATRLSHEVETYNPTTGAVNYWVKLPTLSHLSDTVFYMWYGNSSITTDQSNKTAVWEAGYKGVWHLGNGSTLSANDSTSNANNGTITGATAGTGKIDGGGVFAAGQYISAPNSTSLNITGSFSLEAFVKPSSLSPSAAAVVTKEGAATGYFLYRSGASIYTGFGDGSAWRSNVSGTVLALNAWHHVVSTWDGTTLRTYLNGSLIQSSAQTTSPATNTNSAFMAQNGFNNAYFEGTIDEVRISNAARSPDWVAAEYNNQSSPATFYTISAPLASAGARHSDSVVIAAQTDGTTNSHLRNSDGLQSSLPLLSLLLPLALALLIRFGRAGLAPNRRSVMADGGDTLAGRESGFSD